TQGYTSGAATYRSPHQRQPNAHTAAVGRGPGNPSRWRKRRMVRPRPRALFLALVMVAAAAIVALAVMPNGLFRQTSDSKPTAAAPTGQTAEEPDGEEPGCEAEAGAEEEDAERCELGYFNPRKE